MKNLLTKPSLSISDKKKLSESQLRALLNFSWSEKDRIRFYDSMNKDELNQLIHLFFKKAEKRPVFDKLNFHMMTYLDEKSLSKIVYYMSRDREYHHKSIEDDVTKKRLLEQELKSIILVLGKQLQDELESVYKRDHIFLVHQMALSFVLIVLELCSRWFHSEDPIVNHFFSTHYANEFKIRYPRCQRKPKDLNNKNSKII